MSLRRIPARLLALCTGLATAVPLILVATALPAQAQSWNVPSDAKVTVRGHGYGHGTGMSQYGAQGAARKGLGHRKILKFYYPGTRVGSATGRIRVKLNSDTTDGVLVQARSKLRVRDLAKGKSFLAPANGATRWRLEPAGSGTSVDFQRGGAWQRYRLFSGTGEFFAGGRPIKLVLPNGSTPRYRGRLRSAAPAAGSSQRDTVNVVQMEQYLRGVVPHEVPALWSPAALRAQSVAARTYAAYERARPARHYDICDTTSCQVYRGRDGEHANTDAAIKASRWQALTYRGSYAFTQFSASSGGWTKKGSRPYLKAKRDPYDNWAGNGVHNWKVTFSDNKLERLFPAVGNLTRIVVNRRDGKGQWGGRIESVTFIGKRGRATVSGDTMRWRLGLRSTYATFRVSKN